MIKADVAVIGAGAAGLMTAVELSKAGKKAIIFEARDRIGGRINTIEEKGFSLPLDTGAEFIHGALPVTEALLKEAGVNSYPVKGEIYQIKDRKIYEEENFVENRKLLIKKLDALKDDIPFAEFIEKYLIEEKHRTIRESIVRFAEGYDAADIKKLSSFALREELKSGGASNSSRPEGGYITLIKHLAKKSEEKDIKIYLSKIVKRITWKEGEVKIITTEKNDTFFAKKVLVTVPLGILQSDDESTKIKFSPEIPEIISAAKLIGYGSVIKIFLQFKDAFWEDEKFLRLIDLSFMVSDTPPIQAWWTQFPDAPSLLVGWMTGPQASEFFSSGDEIILEKTIELLSKMFRMDEEELIRKISASKVINWAADPFSKGAYAYSTVESEEAKKIISQSVYNTIYFAGEAFYEGCSLGTVEDALSSGKETAKKILKSLVSSK